MDRNLTILNSLKSYVIWDIGVIFLCFLVLQSSEECDSVEEPVQEDEGFMGMAPLLQAHHAMERVEEFVCKVRRQMFTKANSNDYKIPSVPAVLASLPSPAISHRAT